MCRYTVAAIVLNQLLGPVGVCVSLASMCQRRKAKMSSLGTGCTRNIDDNLLRYDLQILRKDLVKNQIYNVLFQF